MKAAVLDLGTNTFHLIIAEISGKDSVEVLFKTNAPVKLGEGRINDNVIIPAAFERGLSTLREFRKEIDRHGAVTIRAVATSALRNALNAKEFLSEARKIGIEIEVISGDQEAEYIFQGVRATGVIQNGNCALIMDIGGGSTEFIICTEKEMLWKRSYDIGAARLMQAYFHSDPISPADRENIIKRIDSELLELKKIVSIYKPNRLIGSAGAFESFAILVDEDLSLHAQTYSSIDLQAYRKLAEYLLRTNQYERANLKNLIPLRRDMIIVAVLLTNYVLDACQLNALFLSMYDLKMGVLHSMGDVKRP